MKVSSWKEIVVQFDVQYDLTFAHDQGLGELMRMGAWIPPSSASCPVSEDRIRYLGACWCRMRSADVLYQRLHDGLDAYLDSCRLAEEATDRLLASRGAVSSGPGLPEPEVVDHNIAAIQDGSASETATNHENLLLPAYVVARWWDSYGRLYYRCGDHTVARLAFEKAKKIAELYSLWWCSPDVTSNWLRAGFEELKGFEKQADFDGTQYSQMIEKSLTSIGSWEPPPPFDSATCRREHARGLASLRHNYAHWLRVKGEYADANEIAKLSLYWAVENKDDYRAAQSQLFFGQDNNANIGDRQESLNAVVRSSWVRGRKIASQNLLNLNDDFIGLVELGRKEFDALSGREKQAGLDLDIFIYTVSLAKAKAASHNSAGIASGSGRPDALAQLSNLERECYEMQRQVTTVSSYKKNFSNHVRPYFLEQLADSVTSNSRSAEDEFSLVEEASARELLDIVAQRGGK